MTPALAMLQGVKIGLVTGLGLMLGAIGHPGLALAHFAVASLFVVTGVLRLRRPSKE